MKIQKMIFRIHGESIMNDFKIFQQLENFHIQDFLLNDALLLCRPSQFGNDQMTHYLRITNIIYPRRQIKYLLQIILNFLPKKILKYLNPNYNIKNGI